MTNRLSTLLAQMSIILWIISHGSQVAWAVQDNQDLTKLVTVQTQDNHKLVFIYVHGLGGNNKETPFVHNLKKFIKENQFANFKVVQRIHSIF
jgi:predicted alpha/beta-fold hydrolase